MSKTQLITFQPMDAFFFGGETTFGNGEARNFFAASNHFPQQTSLVGVLRYALLEAGISNIGNSFVMGEKPDFGALTTLSPVFIYDTQNKDYGIPIQLPMQLKEGGATTPNNYQLSYGTTEEVYLEQDWQPAPVLENYKEKHGMNTYLLFVKSGVLKPFKEVFNTIDKIGIARDREKHTTLDGMFYQQHLLQFKETYCFASLVTADAILFEKLEQRNMYLGGEQVNFVLNSIPFDTSFQELFEVDVLQKKMDADQDWVFLASDAYVESSIYKYCQFAVTTTRDFRNIVTANNHFTSDLKNEKQTKGRYKSEKFTLLKRGSVLFPNDRQALIEALQNTDLQTIGYNQYFTNLKYQSA